MNERARSGGRAATALRPVTIEPGILRHAEGSALISTGDTRVICTASVEPGVPAFLRGTASGRSTAEDGMLPRTTHSPPDREDARGRQGAWLVLAALHPARRASNVTCHRGGPRPRWQ